MAKPDTGRAGTPRVGAVNLGDLDRIVPVSVTFGFDRGTPIDRYYIERFLEREAWHIHGRVLELRDSSYSGRFGGSRIVQQDVLDLSADNPEATIVGDMCEVDTLP